MERVLQETGPCGQFQVRHVILTEMCRFVATWAVYLMVYGLYNPGWRCVQTNHAHTEPTQLMNDTMTSLGISHHSPDMTEKTSSIPNSFTGDDSFMVTVDSYNDTCDIIGSCVDVEFDSTSSTIVTEFGLHCDRVWIGHLIVSVLNCGQLLGALFWGQFGERFGRKPCLYLSTVAMMVPCGLAVFSPTWEVYASFSFLIGFGCASVTTVGSVLNSEFLNAKWRAIVAAVPVLNMSTVCFALVAFILRDWKYVHLATTFAMVITCLGYFWTPESLRWLMVHGKMSDAQKVVKKIGKMNKKPISQERLERAMKSNGNEDKRRHYTYLDLFRTREIRLLTIKLGTIRFVCLFVYEMIGFAIQSLPGDFYTNIIMASLVDLPLALARGPLANKIGRRYTGIMFTAIGVLSSTCLVTCLLILDADQVRDNIVTAMALINKSAMYSCLGMHALSVVELMPTAVRNVSFGFYNTVTRIISIAGPFMLPTDDPSMVAFFGVFLVFQAITTTVYCLLPETKDKPLKDTIQESSVLEATSQKDIGPTQIAIISFKRIE